MARLCARVAAVDWDTLRRGEVACAVGRGRLNRRMSGITAWHADLTGQALNRDVTDRIGQLCLWALSGDRRALDELAALDEFDPLAADVVALFAAAAAAVSRPESATRPAVPSIPLTSLAAPCAGHRSRRRRRPDRAANRCLSAVVLACAPPLVSLNPT